MERDEESQSDKELPPTFKFTQNALKKVEAEAKKSKYTKVVDNLEGTFTNALEEVRKGNRSAAWPPLRLCLGSSSSKLLIVTLDTITKLCAHSIFQDGLCDEPVSATRVVPPLERRNSFTEGEATPPASQVSLTLAEDIINTVCQCKAEDEAVRLQLIRVILTSVTCTCLEVHESHLLKAVGALFSVYLATQTPVNRSTAKASLQQLLSYVFARMEIAQIDLNGSPGTPSERERASSLSAEGSGKVKEVVENLQGGSSTPRLQYNVDNSWHSSFEYPDSMYMQVFDVLQLRHSAAIHPTASPSHHRHIWARLMEPTGNFPTVLHKDAYLIFRALCRASSRSSRSSRTSASSGTDEGVQRDGGNSNVDAKLARKMLSLELLLGVIDRSGLAFQTSDRFAVAVPNMLCGSILKNCASNETPVVELSLRIFLALCKDFRKSLKAEIEVFITKIFLKILLSPLSPYEHKALVLDLVCTLCSSTQILIEVFINYDCEPEAVNLYAQIVESLSKIAKGPGIGMGGRENPGTASGSPSFREETYNLQNLALDTLVKILTSLLHALGETTTTPDHNIEPSTAIAISNDAGNEDSNDESSYEEADELNAAAIQVEDQHHHQEQPINGMVNGSSHHDSGLPSHDVMSHTNALRSKKSMDDEISSRLWKFNVNPVEEIESLQACGALGMTPADVAQFLHSWSGKLDKTTIGDYLCYENGSPKGDGEDDFNALVLQEYINQLDFEGHSIDNALRMFVCGFRLSEEYKIEWVMKKFVERYCLQNPNTFTSEERAFVLVNSAILLSISLQNSVKKQRWTVERFINENKDDEDGGEQQQLLQLGGSGDDDISYLRDMFYRIKKDPIVVVAHSSRTSTNVIHAYDRKKKMDELLSNGILRFNLNPGKGVDRLQACGAVGKTPADVARFLHSWSEKLDKAAIGDYLSREKEYKGGFNVLVLHEYVDQMVFSDLRFDDAIRYYLSGFRLPGEAQKIDRMMEKFAERYCLQNPAVFPSADTAFILAFSIIMLNTDLHNPAIKEERRMTVEGFIGNNRGIGDGSNLDEGFLRDIFDSIKNNPIRLKEDDELREQLVVGNDSSPHGLGLGLGLVYGLTGMTSTADRAKREAAYSKERVDMLRSSQALFRERRQEKLDAAAENNPPASQALSRTSHSGRMINESVGKLASVQEDGEGGDRNKFLVPDIALGEADALAYVRAMFDVAWWPMLGAFSQVLEECCGQSTGELYSPEGVGRVMVEHCLEGCRLGLRLSARCVGGGSFPISMPDNVDGSSENGPRPLAHNISREAFVNTLGKFTLLEGIYNNTMQEMHPHHLRCISTLLVIAREDGEYLEESWGCVLRLLSQLVRLLILAEGLASDGEFFESPSQGSSSFMERRGSMNTIVKRTNRAKVKGAAKWQMSNAALIQAEISMELIDRIFTNSINLSTSGIHYLVHHLCSISHLELNPESSVVPPTLKEGGGDSSSSAIQAPRIFALQKLVEVADFNMDVRGRLVWAGIWETLSGHFSEIGAHENPQLAMYAIDSLRQLAMKFMVKEELRDFNFQRVVLRPFEAITATGNCTEEHVTFILHCIEQLVQATGKSIRSGWKSVLSILSTAIRGWSLATTNLAWGILQKIVEEEFSALSYDFLDIIKCLLSVLQKEDSEEMSLLAVKSLCRCANFLGRGKGKDGSSNTQNENGKTANLSVLTPPPHPHLHDRSKRFNQSTTSSTMRYKTLEGVSSNNPDEVSEEAHLTLWWPLLFGLSESVEDRRKEVRHACLDALTTILEEYGSPFSTQTWLLLLKAVLFPIFENTATDLVQQPSSYSPTADTFPPSSSEESSSTHDGSAEAVVGSSSNIAQAYSSSWTAVTAPLALQTCCRILVAHPSRLFPLFSDILGVYKSCICQEREGLARIGVKGLVYLIQELEKKCPDAVVEQNEGGGDEITKTVWYCITDFLCDIMQYNFPTDFLEKVITTTPPSNSPQLLSWEELEDVITVPTSPSGLMTMMVVSQQLVCAVRDMLLMFGRKGRSSFISLLGARNIKCLVEMISKSTAIYWSFNDCLPLRVSLAQDNFMLHLDGKKNKGYSSTANQEYNSWIAEVQLAVVLGLGVDFENGEKIKDPQNLEGACDDELIRIFTSVVACYCRRQEILRSFREVKSEAEEDDEVAVHASIMLENMDSMTPTVVEVLKMLQYLSADQFQENVACIYSTLVKLIRSDSILVRDAVQEIMSNRLQVFIHEIQTVVSSRPQMHQAVIQ